MNTTSRNAALAAFLKTTAICSVFFTALVAVLLFANSYRLRQADPFHLSTMKTLQSALKVDPANAALREQIRNLDFLARRAFFSSTDFLYAGAWLLLGSASVSVAAILLLLALQTGLPAPGKYAGPDESVGAGRRLARPLIIGAAGVLVVAALLIGRRALPLPPPADAARLLPAGGATNAAPLAAIAGFPSAEELRRQWPFFRGPEGVGIAYATNVPTEWNAATGAGVVWTSAVPLEGLSSPVLWSNRVFLTGGGKAARELYCFDSGDGRLLWRHAADNIPGSPSEPPEVSEDTGFAASTPATDGSRVYAIFATGDLVATDPAGKRVWAKALGVPENSYGHSSSLIVYQDLLLVQYDHNAAARLMALDAATGREVWATPRKSIAWGSPICVNTGSRVEAILTSSTAVDSYDPRSGRQLWGEACLNAEVGTSAAYADGMVFAANQYSVGVGIRIGLQPGQPPSAVAWQYSENLPDVASPLAAAGRVFFAASDGTISCLSADAGQLLWEHTFENGFYASPILADGRVYALDRAGVMRIFDAANSFVDRGAPAAGEPCSATPAFADGRIYVRGKKTLFCIGAKAKAP
jgi:outer membrane protein assembly factor BamB